MIARALSLLAFALLAVPPSAAAGDIVGTVRLEGPAPPADMVRATTDLAVCGPGPRPAAPIMLGPDGGLRDAVVYLAHEKLEGWQLPGTTFVMDQRGCEFVPRVLVVPPGATIEVHNSDGVLHNFHTLSRLNPRMNLGQRAGAPPLRVRFDEPEFVPVRCDIHGKGVMRAWVVVAAHPFYAVSDASGRFRLSEVPPGPHTLAVWHERLGQLTVPVTVGAGGEVQIDVAFPTPRPGGGP